MNKFNFYNMDVQIIDENLNSITEEQKYINDVNVSNIIDTIKKLDINKISPIQSFNLLCNFKDILTKS